MCTASFNTSKQLHAGGGPEKHLGIEYPNFREIVIQGPYVKTHLRFNLSSDCRLFECCGKKFRQSMSNFAKTLGLVPRCDTRNASSSSTEMTRPHRHTWRDWFKATCLPTYLFSRRYGLGAPTRQYYLFSWSDNFFYI